MAALDHPPGLPALAKAYLANQLTHHPGRYLELVRILQKYRLHAIAAQLGLLHQHEADRLALSTGEEHPPYAEHLARALEELGPCFIKLGQVMSTRPDLLPAPYIAALSRLQDTVTPVSSEFIVEIIERDLGASLSQLFQSFDAVPLATASIAQVHRALLSDGREVVVKVQRPGVRQQVEIDIEVMQEAARFLTRYTPLGIRYGLLQMVQELKQSLSQELDFLQEAENTRLISQALGDFAHLTVPAVYHDYSSSRVLTLSLVHGQHLAQVPSRRMRELDTPTIARELLSAYLKQMVVEGMFHCDPHPGNILLTEDGRLALLDFGMVGRLDAGQKVKVILLLLAFSERQGERVAELYLELVETPERFDRRAFTQDICGLISRYHDMSQGRMDIGRALLDLARVAQSYRTSVPATLTLLGKAMLNLDGTLRVLAPELHPIQIIRGYMEEVMQQQALAQFSPGRLYAWFLDVRHLVENLPRRTDVIVEKLASDQFTLRLEVDHLSQTMHQAAKRISFGMLVTALILSISFLVGMRGRGTRA